jgi:hypothetical protein
MVMDTDVGEVQSQPSLGLPKWKPPTGPIPSYGHTRGVPRQEAMYSFPPKLIKEKNPWNKKRGLPPNTKRPLNPFKKPGPSYRRYLKSQRWETKRFFMLKQARYQCEACGARNVLLNCHHLTYERLGNERRDDLQILCRDCHKKVHGIEAAD